MTKLILSTGNIVSGGPSIIRKPGAYRSNLELTNSLRSNFLAAQQEAAADLAASLEANGGDDLDGDVLHENGNGFTNGNGRSHVPLTLTGTGHRRPPLATWTQREGSVLYVPHLDWLTDDKGEVTGPVGSNGSEGGRSTGTGSGLEEEESQYETTVKLFFVSGARTASAAERGVFAQEALELVFRELGVSRVDLLVLSFPSGSSDGDDTGDCGKAIYGGDVANGRSHDDGGDSDEMLVATWAATAETLHAQGKAVRLGVAEFGGEKLARFLKRVRVRPAVDQVNLQRCCSVPAPLALVARKEGIELLVHTDCTDVLPPGTLRELLGQGLQGAGVLAEAPDTDLDAVLASTSTPDDALRGDLTPQWVVKYTAVVRDRGVIENKGYFAGAELRVV